MKKITFAAAAVIVAITATGMAYAESAINVEMTSGKYHISGIYDDADFNRTALLTVKNQSDEIVCFDTIRVTTDGELDYYFELPYSTPTGQYTFLLSGYDSENPITLTMDSETVITYINSADIQKSLKVVDAAGDNMQSVIEANKYTLRISYNKFYPYYESLPSSGKAAIARAVKQSVPYGSDIDKFDDVFYKALAIEALKAGNANNAERILNYFSEYYSITATKAYPLYERYYNSRSVIWEDFIKNLTGYSNFEESFNNAAILGGIYKANTWGDVVQILTDYESEIPFKIQKSSINIAAKAIIGKHYQSMSALESAINAAIDTNQTGSSSGGSGGSGKSNSTVSSDLTAFVHVKPNDPIQIQSEVQPDIERVEEKFDDINEAIWAKDAIAYLKDNGVLNGFDGKVYPNRLVTREEFVKMVLCAFDMYEGGKDTDFTDVSKDDWAYEYIACASEKGIISGISSTEFGRGQNIRREDAAVIIARAMAAKGTDVSDSGKTDFTDGDEISDYALNSVAYLAKMGVINGFEDGRFRPDEGATRAEAAQMLYGLMIMEEER